MTAPVIDFCTGDSTDFASSTTKSVTFASVANRAIYVIDALEGGGPSTNCTGATYNGNALTAVEAQYDHSGGFTNGGPRRTRIYYLAGDGNIATGAHNVVVSRSDGNQKSNIIIIGANGVDSNNPISGLIKNHGAASPASFSSISSSADALAVAAFIQYGGGVSSAPASGETELADGSFGGLAHTVAAYSKAGASSVSLAPTLSVTNDWWGYGFSINGLSGAALGGTPSATAAASGSLTTEIRLAASVAATAAAQASLASIAVMRVTLTDKNDTPLANLSGIRGSIYVETTANALLTKLLSFTNGTTDSNGMLTVPVVGGAVGQDFAAVIDNVAGRRTFNIGTFQ